MVSTAAPSILFRSLTRVQERYLVARQDLKRGEEVFISYGPVPNSRLFLYYGFIVKNNPHDALTLVFDMGADDILSKLTSRRELLTMLRVVDGKQANQEMQWRAAYQTGYRLRC